MSHAEKAFSHDYRARCDVLHVPYTYFPSNCGGTEVFVRGLARALIDFGVTSAIAAPGASNESYQDSGLQVDRFKVDDRNRLALAYGVPDETAAANFDNIVRQRKPGIVHLHAHTSAVSGLLVDVAHKHGARVILTYHSPTVSCPRGTQMHNGVIPCDGRVEGTRCVACVLEKVGVPLAISKVAAVFGRMSERPARLELDRKPFSVLRVPGLVYGSLVRCHEMFDRVDHIVAVCDWVQNTILANGVPQSKVSLSRQGISWSKSAKVKKKLNSDESITIGYFGRVDITKGIDLVCDGLSMRPNARVQFFIHGIRQEGLDSYYSMIEEAAKCDARLNLMTPLAPDQVVPTMSHYDFIAVPSRWLETGPLVVLEAFAAGVPVLGARRGGIAELVEHDVDGWLLDPDEPIAWAETFDRLTDDRTIPGRLAAGIKPPKSITRCAEEMAELYTRLC